MQGRTNYRLWAVGAAVVAMAGALIYFAGNEDSDDLVPAEAARSAQVSKVSPRDTPSAKGTVATMVKNEGRPAWVSTRERVLRHEALPCTGPRDPINFEVYSVGPAIAGVPMTAAIRRCDPGALADEMPSNYFAYLYGECQPQPDVGCLPPLQIRSYPACERTYADYSFEGKPEPYAELPPIGGAKVFEIEFLVDHRIEVYTGTSTIVISAADWSLAEKALEQLRDQPSGEIPAATAAAMSGEAQGDLEPPEKEAIEGDLPCHV